MTRSLNHARRGLLAALLLAPAALAVDKPDLDHGYYYFGAFQPVSINTSFLSVRFPADASDDHMRSYLTEVEGVDVALMPQARVSEDRLVEVPLRRDLSPTAVLAMAERLDAAPGVVFAMPYVVRTGERLGLTHHLLLSMKKDVSPAEAEALFAERSLRVVERLPYVEHGYMVELPKGSHRLTIDEARWFFERGVAEWAEPDFVVERVVRAAPNDIYFQYQWHLHNTGQSGATVDADIDAVEAWDVTRGSTGITIAIIDDGVETAHEDLSPNMVTGYDFLSNDSNPNPGSSDHHGTAVAGTAAARGGNSIGVSGVAQLCKIMPIRLVGFGQTSSKEASAFSYAADNGADVINNSWGPPDGTGQSQPAPQVSLTAIDYAATSGRAGKGCIIMWAAGNGNESADLDGYASYSKVISVAASTDFDKKASYSDFGSTVDVCAPSSGGTSWGIVTVDRTGNAGYSTGTYASGFGGTSAASPVACGVAALMLSANSALTRTEVYNLLTTTTDKIDPAGGAYNGSGHSTKYGYGRVNAKKAVDAAAAGGGGGGGGSGFVSFTSSDVPKSIPDNNSAGVSSVLSVSGMSGNLTDVDVDVNIVHTYKGDLEVYLQKPNGTSVQLHNNTGGSADNIITTYDTLTTPTQPLSNLFGGSPNGTWRLWVYDQAAQDVGTISGWTLRVKTDGGGGGGGGPVTQTYNAADTPKSIPDNNATGINSFINVSGQGGSITEVNVTVNITHTYKADLQVTLISPSGTSVILHNKTGGSADNVITTFDTQTVPAQSLTALNGQGATGQWRLNVNDTWAQDVGTLNSWSLQVTTQ